MISISTFLSFFLASTLLSIAPGPDNLFVITQSALYGRRAGLLVVLGLCSGLLVHTGAVSLGVATIIQSSPTAFTVLKAIGSVYLSFLAYRAFKASSTAKMDGANTAPPPSSSVKLYGRGIVMNVTNPKVLLFFLAFLPQFVEANKGSVALQLASLGLVFILATATVFSILAIGSGTIGEKFLKSPSSIKLMNQIAGLVFIGLAIKLIL